MGTGYPAGAERQFANTVAGRKELISGLQEWPSDQIAFEANTTYKRALEVGVSDWPYVKLSRENGHLTAAQVGSGRIITHNRDASGETTLTAQTLEYPHRYMLLFGMHAANFQYLIEVLSELGQLPSKVRPSSAGAGKAGIVSIILRLTP